VWFVFKHVAVGLLGCSECCIVVKHVAMVFLGCSGHIIVTGILFCAAGGAEMADVSLKMRFSGCLLLFSRVRLFVSCHS